jgi:hypothetical protein
VANRYDIVVNGNIHKFNQHPAFTDFLINTKDRVLVEASPIDKIWGIGLSKDADQIDNPYFWNGQNLLGFALMEVRDFLVNFGRFEYPGSNLIPPWKSYPEVDPTDLFWRMGIGEKVLSDFFNYYDSFNERDKVIFRLCITTPHRWKSVFNE